MVDDPPRRSNERELRLPPWVLRLTLVAPAPQRVSCYLLGREEALLVDPGADFPRELERVRREVHRLRGSGGGLQAILVTHHHRDHAAGALGLARELGVPVAGHPLTLARLARGRARPWLRAVEDGERLRLGGGLELLALHTPGHAPGHLCLFDPAGRVLLAGDQVPGEGTTLIDPPEGEMASYLDSLRRLLRARPRAEVLLPAHGPPRPRAAARIRGLLHHRLWREARVLAALEETPRALAPLAREAYEELALEGPIWRWPLAVRSTLAHLIKLAADGKARRVGELWAAG